MCYAWRSNWEWLTLKSSWNVVLSTYRGRCRNFQIPSRSRHMTDLTVIKNGSVLFLVAILIDTVTLSWTLFILLTYYFFRIVLKITL